LSSSFLIFRQNLYIQHHEYHGVFFLFPYTNFCCTFVSFFILFLFARRSSLPDGPFFSCHHPEGVVHLLLEQSSQSLFKPPCGVLFFSSPCLPVSPIQNLRAPDFFGSGCPHLFLSLPPLRCFFFSLFSFSYGNRKKVPSLGAICMVSFAISPSFFLSTKDPGHFHPHVVRISPLVMFSLLSTLVMMVEVLPPPHEISQLSFFDLETRPFHDHHFSLFVGRMSSFRPHSLPGLSGLRAGKVLY